MTDIQRLLEGVAANLAFDREAPVQSLKRRWRGLVGERIASHARPEGIRSDRLQVWVDHPGWLRQLRAMKLDLLKQINSAGQIPPLQDMIFRTGRPSASRQPYRRASRARRRKIEIPPDLGELIETYLQPVHDPGLKAVLRQTIVKSLLTPPRPRTR
ncbi:MAG: DUF721 domain-containing protein, partial [Deltaproteobacteria bacterium]|nr:DUF721 domain-containing protein [Deltaproteobacteria bacterium]